MIPEKLNLWDRIFNRYRKEVMEEGNESWTAYRQFGGNVRYGRDYVKYKIVDRLTGSVTIKKEYLN